MLVATFKTKIRNLIFDLNHIVPILGRFPLYGWTILHKFKFLIGKKILELRGQLKYITKISNIDKIYWVNPQKIQFYLKNDSKINSNSKILKSDWEKSKKLFEDLPVYQALKQKFKEGKNWKDIEYFKEESDDKLKEIELIHNQIKKNVFKSKVDQQNLKDDKILERSVIFEDITVIIGRNGQLINLHGNHILSMAILLGIPKIPIKIIARHKNWINFKKRLSYYSRHRSLYQFPIHPDLQEFPFSYGESRFDMIKENLSISQGTLLDIGANFGYFSYKFEDEGFDCYAVEANWLNAYFLKKLRNAENRKFKVITGSIFNYHKNKELNFDVIFALNIFHHFLRRKNTYHVLIKLLNRIKVKEFFFGAHKPKEFWNIKSYRNYSPDQFVNFLIENSHLSKAKFIGKTKNGRSLYKLTP